MKTLLTPAVLIELIKTVGAIILAIIPIVYQVRKNSGKNAPKEGSDNNSSKESRMWRFVIITSVVVFFLTFMGLEKPVRYLFSPRVSVTNITDGEDITVTQTPNGGYFKVEGSSSRLAGNNALRIVVLIHPSQPFSQGWWMQAATVFDEKSGKWKTVAWLGNREYPPQVGQKYDLVALVIGAESIPVNPHVNDPGDLNPSARSKNTIFGIGQLTPE
jgi:hypothetical protein